MASRKVEHTAWVTVALITLQATLSTMMMLFEDDNPNNEMTFLISTACEGIENVMIEMLDVLTDDEKKQASELVDEYSRFDEVAEARGIDLDVVKDILSDINNWLGDLS